MAWPALLARVVVAALKRYAPRYVGAALKVLGVVELGDLARSAWKEVFGDDARHAEAIEGYQAPGEPPEEVVAYLQRLLERDDAAQLLDGGSDPIIEEEVLRQLDAAEEGAGSTPALRVEVIQRAPRARRKRSSCS